jgi:hypothetical protein
VGDIGSPELMAQRTQGAEAAFKAWEEKTGRKA